MKKPNVWTVVINIAITILNAILNSGLINN